MIAISVFKFLVLFVGFFIAVRQWRADNRFRAVATGLGTLMAIFIINLVV